jgi:hypothetical protein
MGLPFVAEVEYCDVRIGVDGCPPPMESRRFRKMVSIVVDAKGREAYSLPVWNDLSSVTFSVAELLDSTYFSSIRT